MGKGDDLRTMVQRLDDLAAALITTSFRADGPIGDELHRAARVVSSTSDAVRETIDSVEHGGPCAVCGALPGAVPRVDGGRRTPR